MTQEQSRPAGPDLTLGVAAGDIVDGKLLGHVGDQDVLVVRTDDGLFAIDAHCTHYHGPLAEGLVTGNSVRCPWHHACFDLRTGEATRAPALSPLACWQVEERDGRIFVREKQEQPKTIRRAQGGAPERIAIDGDISARDCLVQYKRKGRVLATASIYRNIASLQAELAMER